MQIGRLENIMRYPVKSMAGEALDQVGVTYAGLQGDRVHALVDPTNHSLTFPWLTIRENPRMLLYRAKFVSGPTPERPYPNPEQYDVEITTPTGEKGLLRDPDFCAELRKQLNADFHLRFSERGMPDSRPLQLFSFSTLRELSKGVDPTGETTVDPLRFRANLYVEWDNDRAFYEEELVGRVLRIGETVQIQINKKDPRCVIINVNPADGTKDPTILKYVGKAYRGNIGVYAVTIREGVVQKGDRIYLE